MKYGSVCSGIEAATVAWEPLGWKAQWFSEIEAFPNKVLADHYPAVPNLGDMTKMMERKEFHERPIDLLVGGTPCQSFSLAGLRKGMDDPRGNLALHFLKLVDTARPKWVVWENVPGVLSSWTAGKDGRHLIETSDFDTFTAGLAELGYGVAGRILDAQYFGIPQRRRRVFVVGYLGDWRPAAAVLFEPESLSGNSPPSRKKREGIAGGFETGPHAGGYTDVAPTLDVKAKDGPIRNQIGVGVIAPEISPAMKSRDYKGVSSNGYGDGLPLITGALTNAGGKSAGSATNQDVEAGMVIVDAISFKAAVGRTGSGQPDGDVVASLMSQHKSGDQTPLVAIRTANTGANGHGISEDVAHTIDQAQGQAVMYENHPSDSRIKEVEVAPNLNSRAGTGGNNLPLIKEVAPTLRAMPGQGPGRMADDAGAMGMVRRLTPRECERLQGFPDDYTLLMDKKGKACADGPRYKALGNSMAVPVMAWLGKRIQMVEDVLKPKK